MSSDGTLFLRHIFSWIKQPFGSNSASPSPRTWRVLRLTESHTRTWGASCCPEKTPKHTQTWAQQQEKHIIGMMPREAEFTQHISEHWVNVFQLLSWINIISLRQQQNHFSSLQWQISPCMLVKYQSLSLTFPSEEVPATCPVAMVILSGWTARLVERKTWKNRHYTG